MAEPHNALQQKVSAVREEPLTVVDETTGLVRETAVREFLGWLSADIPELHAVEVPRLEGSWERYKAMIEEAARDGAYL